MKCSINTSFLNLSELTPAIEAGVADTSQAACVFDEVAIEEVLSKVGNDIPGQLRAALGSSTFVFNVVSPIVDDLSSSRR